VIDRATGALHGDGLALPIGAGLSRTAFLASPLGAGAVVWVQNEPYCSFRTDLRAGAARFAAVCWFRGSLLTHVSLYLLADDSGASWDEWSEAAERQRQQAHDAWLRAQLGRPPYRYSWGTVESSYDPRAGASEIVVRYTGQRR
jgi:hypothetical protein